MLSTPKEQSEPQSYEKYLCNCQKKLARNGLKIANSLSCAFRFESDFKKTLPFPLTLLLSKRQNKWYIVFF